MPTTISHSPDAVEYRIGPTLMRRFIYHTIDQSDRVRWHNLLRNIIGATTAITVSGHEEITGFAVCTHCQSAFIPGDFFEKPPYCPDCTSTCDAADCETELDPGESFCTDHAEACTNCGERVAEVSDVHQRCDECVSYCGADDCETEIYSEGDYCGNHAIFCNSCGNWVAEVNDYGHCEGCGIYCAGCGEATSGSEYCGCCEPSDDGIILDYNDNPEWDLISASPKDKDQVYIGAEVETTFDSPSAFGSFNWKGGYPATNWIAKSDGSLPNGRSAELVSHPRTIAAWRKEDLSLFDDVRAAGGRSWDTSCCGMHVHLSRPSVLTVFKLLSFVYDNSQYIQAIGRRGDRQSTAAADYCQFPNGSETTTRGKARKAKDGNHQRYEPLNITTHTIEFRIFRGTLDKVAFMRNIEWTRALLAFAETASIREMTRANFERSLSNQALKNWSESL